MEIINIKERVKASVQKIKKFFEKNCNQIFTLDIDVLNMRFSKLL